MAIEPQIANYQPFKMPDPLEIYGRLSQIQSGESTNRLNQMKLQEGEREINKRNALSKVYGGAFKDGKFDQNNLLSGIAGSEYADEIPNVMKQMREQESAAATLQGQQLTNTKTQQANAAEDSKYWAQKLGSFLNTKELSQELLLADPDVRAGGQKAIDLVRSLSKDPVVLRDQITRMRLAVMSPKEQNEVMNPKKLDVERKMDAAGIVDPAERSRIIRQALEKETTHASSPFGTNAIAGEQNGKPVFFQPGINGKPSIVEGITPPTKAASDKALPVSAAQKLFENQSNLRRSQQALELISGTTADGKPLPLIDGKTAGGQVPDTDATGLKGYLPEAVLQRIDGKGVDARAAISDIGSMIIHDRSGAAVTAAEYPRLRPFIPTKRDNNPTVAKKLRRFVSEYQKIAEEMTEFYSESGYKVPLKNSGGASSNFATPAPKPNSRKVVNGRTFENDGKGWFEVQ